MSLVPLITVAASNPRLVEAFGTDEAMQVNLLHGAAARNSFSLTFGPYGHLVFNLILLALRVIPGPLTDSRIVHTGRAVCVLFAAATLWLTFVWTRRLFGGAAAWIAFAALGVNATLYTWAVILKPDMAQLFFLMLALALACRLADEPRLRWLVLASTAAGLAFACKYSGLLVLPVVGALSIWRPLTGGRIDVRVRTLRWLVAGAAVALLVAGGFINATWIAAHLTEDGHIDASLSPQTLSAWSTAGRGLAVAGLALVVAPWLWSALRRRPRLVAVLWAWTVTALVFATAFVVASPYSLRKAAFLKGLFVEASYGEPLSAAWVSTWFRGIGVAVAWPVLAAAMLTMAGLVWLAISRRTRVSASEWILMAWVVLYALVLSAPLHEFYVQYALPLAPPVAMLAGRGAVAAAEWLGAAFGRRRLAAAATAAVVLGVVAFAVADLRATRSRLLAREATSDAVFLGRWLECRAPASTRVAYDYFSYVPPIFRDATPTWGGTREWLSRLDPDIVIVFHVTAAAAMADAAHAAYYDCLEGGRCGYERMLRRGEYTMYARSGEGGIRLTTPRASTRECEAY